MRSDRYGATLSYLHRLFHSGTAVGVGEGQLLERFVDRNDEVAFEALVSRLGPLVLGVCRRLLDDPRDVEDAFQATFLILVKKAASIRDRDHLGPWLYGVAYRVAIRARARSARRRDRERSGPEVETMAAYGTDRLELKEVLDEEIGRLPEKYRSPIVLCYLEGLTHEEVARRLRCPVGTVHTRMSWARDRLRSRLNRRGVALPGGLLGVVLASEAVPAALIESTVGMAILVAGGKATAGAVSAGTISLMEGVRWTMSLNAWKVTSLVLASLGLVAGGAGVLAQQAGESKRAGDPPSIENSTTNDGGGATTAKPPTAAEYREIRDRADALERRQGELEQEIKSLKQALSKISGFRPGPSTTRRSPPESPAPERGVPLVEEGASNDIHPAGPVANEAMRATKSSIPILSQSSNIIAASPQEGDRVRAFSKTTGRWRTYVAPKDSRIKPILDQGILGLLITGPEVRQLAVFCANPGEWYTQEVEPPFQGAASPLLFDRMTAFYVLGNRVYAFSALAHKWDVVEMEKGATPDQFATPLGPGYRDSKSLYVFDVSRGKWERVDWEAIEAKPDSSGNQPR